MRPIKNWIIRDRGTKAHLTGKYFAGWNKNDPTDSWKNERTNAKPFATKKEAFKFLRKEFKGQEQVYSPLGSSLRFVVMRVYAARGEVHPTSGPAPSKERVSVRGGGEDSRLSGRQTHEEAGAGPGRASGPLERAQKDPRKEEAVVKKSPQLKAWESRRARQSAEAQPGAKKRDRSKGRGRQVGQAA